jgi:hypothetical protein
MNIAQAKQIPLEDFLRHLGFEPAHSKAGQLWYRSPFRHESEPSFKVNPGRNVWYDFGLGKGGDIIDFIRIKDQVSSVSDALDRIRDVYGSAPAPTKRFEPKQATSDEPPALELIRLQPVRSKSLQSYLLSRGISHALVGQFVQEARYLRDGKEYFALAFANESGGYELRNPHFKGTLGSKAISLREGSRGDHAVVFEGFIDYLTALVMKLVPDDATVVVLNSVGMREHAAQRLKALGTASVELYRDNDSAGTELAEFLRNSLPEASIGDRSGTYAGYNDLNDYWVAHQASLTQRQIAGTGR